MLGQENNSGLHQRKFHMTWKAIAGELNEDTGEKIVALMTYSY